MGAPTDQHALPPQIEGRLLQTIVIARAELPSSPLLPQFTALLIESFGEKTRQPILSPEAVRYPGGSEQLLREIGLGSWTIILADSEDASTMYGTVTIEPKDLTSPPLHEGSTEEARKHPPNPAIPVGLFLPPVAGETRWNVRSLCTNVRFQKRGIADWLMLEAEHSILQQEVQARARRVTETPTTGVRLLLATIKELNGAWYTKRGWGIYNAIDMPPGFLGSESGFTHVEMFKLLQLPPAAAMDI